MILFFCIIGLLIIHGAFSSRLRGIHSEEFLDANKRKYVIVSCCWCILIAGLRNVAIGPDTYAYYLMFRDVQDMRWPFLFARLFIEGEKDPLWYIVLKAFATICPYNRPFLFFIASIFYGGFASLVYRNTRNLYEAHIAFLIFVFLFLSFSFTGHRQLIAIGVCMYSMRFVQERNPWKFALCMLPILFIHRSSMLFWPYYFIGNLKQSKHLMVAALLMLPIVVMFRDELATSLVDISGEERYRWYTLGKYQGRKGAYNYAALLLAIAGYFLMKAKSIKKEFPSFHFISNSVVVVLALLPLAWVGPTMMRTFMYFSNMLPITTSRSLTVMSSAEGQGQMKSAITTFLLIFSLLSWGKYGWAPYWTPTRLGDNYQSVASVYEDSFLSKTIVIKKGI